MIIQDENRLKVWIAHIVEDISDAEPDALAKYVIALVKKPLADTALEELCLEKLSVFLQSHTEPFVKQLFASLKSNEYINQSNNAKKEEDFKLDYTEERVEEHDKHEEEAITAETDELVLTDPETPEQSPAHFVEKKKEDHQKRSSGMVSSSKSSRSEHRDKPEKSHSSKSTRSTKDSKDSFSSTRKGVGASGSNSSGTRTTTTNAASNSTSSAITTRTSSSQQSTTQPTGRPFRKRISPPRSNSAERRGGSGSRVERRVSPISNRRRGNASGSNAAASPRISRHRETRRVRSKSRERTRSPVHVSRNEKRLVADFDLRSLRRHRCRDFHEKGFCMRGDACPYDHGPDPVVADATALEKIVRASGSVFDTTSAYGANPPPPGLENSTSSGKPGMISEGYNPEAPALTTPASMSSIDFSVPPPPIPHQMFTAAALSVGQQQLVYPPGTIPPSQQQQFSSDINPNIVSLLPSSFGGGVTTSTGGGFAHFRTASGGVGHDASAAITALTSSALPIQTTSIYGSQTSLEPIGTTNNLGDMLMRGGRFKPYNFPANRNLTSKSLLVKKIPQDLNKIAQLDQHFSRFGQITNIQVQYEGRPDTALITFKTRRDAMAAYKSVEPILNNRFIKVFWQNDKNAATNEETNIGTTENTNPVTTSSGGGPTIPLSKRAILRPIGCYKKTYIKPQVKELTYVDNGIGNEVLEEKGEKSNEKSTELVTTVSSTVVTTSISNSSTTITTQSKTQPGSIIKSGKRKSIDRDVLSRLKELQRMKTGLYAKLVEQQKTLLEKLQGTEDKEQRKRLITLIKKSESTSLGTKAELEQLANKISLVHSRQTGKHLRITSNLVLTKENIGERHGGVGGEGEVVSEGSPTKTPNRKLFKLYRMVYVLNCPQEHAEKLIVYMEQFGDLFDYDINTEPRVFTYKDPMSAQNAVSKSTTSPFPHATITIEWAPVSKSFSNDQAIVPDGEREPSEQVTPKDLLASLDYDEDEELDNNNNNNNEGVLDDDDDVFDDDVDEHDDEQNKNDDGAGEIELVDLDDDVKV